MVCIYSQKRHAMFLLHSIFPAIIMVALYTSQVIICWAHEQHWLIIIIDSPEPSAVERIGIIIVLFQAIKKFDIGFQLTQLNFNVSD